MKEAKNISASIQGRLRNKTIELGDSFENILYRYVSERFLYRLSISPFCDEFCLKGAFLFFIWTRDPHRPTRDVDFPSISEQEINGLSTIKVDTLSEAITNTFNRRGTALPQKGIVGLSELFYLDPDKTTQWSAFLKRNELGVSGLPLDVVITDLRDFLEPVLH